MPKKGTSSATQKRQQARMKRAMAIAKADYKKNPRKKWTSCVKAAWKKI